jgi:hypothetical protein
MTDLCETFRYQSGRVWNRMAKAPALGMSLSEETLTETALYEIAVEHEGTRDIRITLATKPAEARHGADWTWWLVKGRNCLSLRVQAKRLFPNGTYQSLFKAPPNRHAQLQRLIDAARRDGNVALCCFFNFHQRSIDIDNSKGRCRHSYHGPSFWGCSLASPEKVIAANSDRYEDLQSVMYPWHTLVCNYSYPRNLIDAANWTPMSMPRRCSVSSR